MDFDAAPAPSRPKNSWSFWLLAAVALAAFALLLSRNVAAVAGASDSSGYMNHARLLASGTVHAELRPVKGFLPPEAPAYLYVPLGFRPAPDGRGMVPTYPAGFSLLIMAAAPVAGWARAGDLVMVLHSLAGLVVTFALARLTGLPRSWSVAAAAVVAASPLYLFFSVQAMSDVPSLVWTTLAVIAAAASARRTPWALAAGAALALDVLIRPTNVLAFVPVGIALGASPRRWALLIAGGLPGAVFFLAHGHLAYGSMGATGYGDVSTDFGSRFVQETLTHYLLWMPVLFTPLVLLGLCLPFFPGVPARTRWLLCSWNVSYLAFFAFYKCTHETWWYLRYLLPIAPSMVAGFLLVLRNMLSAGGRQGKAWAYAALAAAVGLAASATCWANAEIRPLLRAQHEFAYERLSDFASKNLPANAVCLSMQATGALFYYTKLTFVRWDFVDGASRPKLDAALRAAGRPLYAILFPFEYDDLQALSRMPGHWSQVGSIDGVVILRRDGAGT